MTDPSPIPLDTCNMEDLIYSLDMCNMEDSVSMEGEYCLVIRVGDTESIISYIDGNMQVR